MENNQKVLNVIAQDDLIKGSYLLMNSMKKYEKKYFFIKSSTFELVENEILTKLKKHVLVLEYDENYNINLKKLIEKINQKIIIISKEIVSEYFEEILVNDYIFLNNKRL